jgi:sulfide:quinone oxidoreductase
MKRIVVLGGGVGGTLAANLLAKRIKNGEAEVVVVSASSRHTFQPGWLYVPFGRQDPLALSRPLKSLLHDRVKLRLGEVVGLDTTEQQVRMASGGDVPYDYLIIATGAHVAPEDVPGLAAGGHHFYTEEAAFRLHAALEEFHGGRIIVGVSSLPYKYPVAPLEFIFLLEEHLTHRHLRHRTELIYTSPIGRVFTTASVAEVAAHLLEERQVRVATGFTLKEVVPADRLVRSSEGTELHYSLLVMVPPQRGAAFLQGHPIADASGWVKTDRNSLQVPGFDNIWALGDAADLPISKAGSAAHFQCPVVVEQIAARLHGTEVDPRHAAYEGHVMCFLETGYGKASLLDFDYNREPQVAEPNAVVHWQKMTFNKTYWYLVPTGVL